MDDVQARAPRWAWGMLLPALGHERCYRCRRPWWLVHGRKVRIYEDTRYVPTLTHYAQCQGCWHRASVDERVEAHRWLVHLHPECAVLSEHKAPWDDIESAIRRDSDAELGWLKE